MKKNLHLSKTNKKIAGVLGGFGEYLNVDPTFLRVFWITITILTGVVPGILIYLFAWMVMPEPQEETPRT
ncbi:MAG: PspC domain-containing protein [Candidatus Paceibacterota bacterium]